MIKYGYSKRSLNSVDLHIYKLLKSQVSLKQVINEPHFSCKSIKEVFPKSVKLTKSYGHDRPLPSYLVVYHRITMKPIFITNYCYFIDGAWNRNYGEIQGRCQGEYLDNRPDQIQWVSGVLTKDFHLKHGYFASWDYEGTDVLLGYSPALVTIHESVLLNFESVTNDKFSSIKEERPLISTACGLIKVTHKNTQTCIMEDNESISIMVVDGPLTPQVISTWVYGEGIFELAFGDSGGSSYAYYYPENDVQ
ncbi:hypothetical protein [Anaerorhabdus sp.]|uniref:hypothetical protein n=1 Tax=Anaerorhabdus sp. TaxID=1872524 RepID=UPI002FC84C0B